MKRFPQQQTVLFLLFLCFPVFVYAQLDNVIPQRVASRLLAGEIVSLVHFDEITPELIPEHSVLVKTVKEIKDELEPSVMVENISLYKKPPPARPWTVKDTTALFNGILSLSTLSGLSYYSSSRKQMRLFYEKSVVIDSPDKQKPVRDPVFSPETLPQTLTIYAKQKDLTFGENIYRFDFTVLNDAILFTQTNLSTMYYGIFPALGKNKIRSIAAVLDAGEYMIIYMVSMADSISFPGIKNRVGASFGARSEAVLKWFAEKANLVYHVSSQESG